MDPQPRPEIHVTCACGARLRGRPDQVGKRLKCPACGAPVVLAAEAAAGAALHAPRPAPPAPPVDAPRRAPSAPAPTPSAPAPAPPAPAFTLPPGVPAPLDPRTNPPPSGHAPPPSVPVPPAPPLAPAPALASPFADFAPPQATSAPQPPPAPPRPALAGLSSDYRIRPGRWLSVGLSHFGAVLLPSIGYYFVFAAIYVLLSFLLVLPIGLLAGANGDLPVVAVALFFALIILAANLFLLPALAIGFHVVGQAQLKGWRWNFGTFFSGFRWTWPLAAREVLLFLVLVVPFLPALAAVLLAEFLPREWEGALVGLQSALQLAGSLAGGYAFLRLAFFSHFLIIDRGCGPIESLRGSWLLSRGHFWGILGMTLLVAGSMSAIAILTLGIGLLFALPAAVLVLNAGYLLVAGAEPLPGQEPSSERSARTRWLPAWVQPAIAAALVLLYGGVTGIWAHVDRAREIDRYTAMEARRAEEARTALARHRAEEARYRQEMDQQGKELVGFFRAGGFWSMELPADYRELEAGEATTGAAPGASPAADPQGLAGPPMGGALGGGIGGFGMDRPRRILVLGPPDLLERKPKAQLGVPSAPESPERNWDEAIRQLDQMHFEDFRRQAFFRHFADALAADEVTVLLVKITEPPPDGLAPGAGGLGEGARPPPGAGNLPALPSAGGAAGGGTVDGGAIGGGPAGAAAATGAAGDLFGAGPVSSPADIYGARYGMNVPLDNAQPLTASQFRALVVEPDEP